VEIGRTGVLPLFGHDVVDGEAGEIEVEGPSTERQAAREPGDVHRDLYRGRRDSLARPSQRPKRVRRSGTALSGRSWAPEPGCALRSQANPRHLWWGRGHGTGALAAARRPVPLTSDARWAGRRGVAREFGSTACSLRSPATVLRALRRRENAEARSEGFAALRLRKACKGGSSVHSALSASVEMMGSMRQTPDEIRRRSCGPSGAKST
jgi:hypothetical protein